MFKNKTLCKPELADISRPDMQAHFEQAYPGRIKRNHHQGAAPTTVASTANLDEEQEEVVQMTDGNPPEVVVQLPEDSAAAEEEETKHAEGIVGASKRVHATGTDDASVQTEEAIYMAHLLNANQVYAMDANAQRFVITKLYLLERKLDKLLLNDDKGLPQLAAQPPQPALPADLSEVMRLKLHKQYQDLLKDFMRAYPDWTWWALSDVLRTLKTSSPDRTCVLLVTFLRVVSVMVPNEDVLMQVLPRCLPPGFPKSLERELAILLRELSQPYRKEQYFHKAHDSWCCFQMAIAYLQQQLLGVQQSLQAETSLAYYDAVDGLETLINGTVGSAEAWEDYLCCLLQKRASDVLRFLDKWDHQTPDTHAHLASLVQAKQGLVH